MGDDGVKDMITSTSTPSFRFQWDVFLSFRGEDTRHNFTELLYDELVRNGVRTFRDDEGLERGEEIAPSLLIAIEDSAASIAVISENYADSKWCLEELVKILECKRAVFPVFYKVDPSDVRRQKGSFEAAFERHEVTVEAQKVSRWREAMSKAGGISGWDSKLWDDGKLIKSLVQKVLTKLSNTPFGVAKYPVGLNSRVDDLVQRLDLKANGTLFCGLHGMGGIGKTTLAKALYNKLISFFKRRSFISDVRDISRKQNGLNSLQGKLIGDLTSSASQPKNDTSQGVRDIKKISHEEPVLIVLDDIDHVDQLKYLAGAKDWFHDGSRIIVTTRTKELLSDIHFDVIYEVEELSYSESLKLFSYHAFGREAPPKDFIDVSEKVVSRTRRLPLALEVFGSSLFYKKGIKAWHDAISKLKRTRPGNLQDVLEISFEGLDEQERCIFLDLACFFSSMNLKRHKAIDIFRGCGFDAETVITDLTAKSLIKVVNNNVLWMHDQLRDMGKEVVRRKNFRDPGERTRLWDHEEVLNVLKNHKGTRSIEGLSLNFEKKHDLGAGELKIKQRPGYRSGIAYLKHVYGNFFSQDSHEDDTIVHTKAFEPMVNLRLLQINRVNLLGNFKLLPAEIKWLQWKGCPYQDLPDEFWTRNIAILDLSESKFRQLWSQKGLSSYRKKMAKKLMVMDLRNCCDLMEIPDLSGLQLEKLILKRCKGLINIHSSVGDLSKLTYLNLKECENLEEFLPDVSGLKCLEKLILSHCKKLRKLPENLAGLKSLRELRVDGTAIMELPISIFRLKSLEIFDLDNCHSLKLLPPSIGNLSSLKELSLNFSGLQEIPDSVGKLTGLEKLSLKGCRSLTSIPDSFGDMESLVELYLDRTSIREIPKSVGSLSFLKCLTAGYCKTELRLPDSIGGLSSLVWLCLEGNLITDLPDQIGTLKNLEKLEMGFCESLRLLPETIGNMLSIKSLILNSTSITELPETIGLLESLEMLNLSNCKNLTRLPSSIGRLKNLTSLKMNESAVTQLPDEIGMLSSLKILQMAKFPLPDQPSHGAGPSETRDLAAKEISKFAVLPESISILSLLQELDAQSCKLSVLSDDFQRLSSLETLKLNKNNFLSLPSSLRGHSSLKHLFLSGCQELKVLPPLPLSLLDLDAANCSSLKTISDLSDLARLRELNLTNCRKILDIPGLECLMSLKRLYTGGCNSCLPSLQKRLSKVTIRHMRFLCVPGSELPSWFVQEIPSFSNRKNQRLIGVLIGVVVSLDQQIQDTFRNKVPAIVDIQAKIIRMNDPVHTTVLHLKGVPDSNDEQLYLCRFQEYNPLVFMLEEGDKLQVQVREEPRFKGLSLKKHGIYLVYENDDDFDDSDEELFDEHHQSISKRLANFFNSL